MDNSNFDYSYVRRYNTISYRGTDEYKKILQYLPERTFDDESARDFIATSVIESHQKIEELHSEINKYEKIISELNNKNKNYEKKYHIELQKIKSDYSEEVMKLNYEKERYSKTYQENIKENARKFLGEVVSSLIKREFRLNLFSIFWSLFGVVCLVFGVYLVCEFSKSNIENLTISWQGFLYYCVRGFGVIGVIGFLSRYAFMQSGNFMKESLRTDDRIHSIRFGQLYIVTYGASAEWKEVKEALSSWNGKTEQDWTQKIKFDEFLKMAKIFSSFHKKIESSSEKE